MKKSNNGTDETNIISKDVQPVLEQEINDYTKNKIKKLARNPEIFDLIINSIVPSVYGHDDIKEAIALQLFGGVTKKVDNIITISGGVNILIVGDPGIGKTHLLKGVLNLAKTGIFIDSNKSNVNGIYQHLSEDIDLKNLDEDVFNQENYLVCIDALKVRPDEILFLKEALGKNSSFNTKEELLNILNSQCSVLAATNPKFGRFDRYKSIAEQINIPSNILSCFDLIFLVEDRNIIEQDSKISSHLLKLHLENKIRSKIEPQFLKKYIMYAREEIEPELTYEAIEMIHEFYIRIRQSFDEDFPIPISARQLESIIKLSEASARIRLSDHVTSSDVKRVLRLYGSSLKQMGFDIGQKFFFEEPPIKNPQDLKNIQSDLNLFR